MKFGKELTWYYKEGDNEFIVSEEKLDNVPNEILEKLVNNIVDKDDPDMYYDYVANTRFLNSIQPFINHEVDLNKYDYFITSYNKNKNTPS